MATKSWSTLALGLVVFVVLLAYVQAQPYDDHLGKLNRNFASGSEQTSKMDDLRFYFGLRNFPTKNPNSDESKASQKMYEILILTTEFVEFDLSRTF